MLVFALALSAVYGRGNFFEEDMYCMDSPQQVCYMMCNHKPCPKGQCRMRKGNCCESECVIDVKMCPGETIFKGCGTACPNSCGKEPAPFCTLQCVPECQCPGDLFRTIDNRCVEQDQCPQSSKCPGDTEFQECGTSCPLICGEEPADFCTQECVRECQCPAGLFRTKDSRCVKEDECGETFVGECDEFEEWDVLLQKCVAVECGADPCKDGETCVEESRMCFRSPCPQFKCVTSCEDGQFFDKDLGMCIELTFENYQKACASMTTKGGCIGFGCGRFKKNDCSVPQTQKQIKCKAVKDGELCKALKCKYKRGKCKGKANF